MNAPKTIQSTMPGKSFTLLGQVQASSEQEIVKAVEKARDASPSWGMLDIAKRVEYVSRLREVFLAHSSEIQELERNEIGKTYKDVAFRFENGIEYMEWLEKHAVTALAPRVSREDDTSIHHMVYEPMGVAAVIAPWNHPFLMMVWGIVPCLLAGNTIVFKHSEECPLLGKYVGSLIDQIGLPEGVFNQIYGDREEGRILVDQDVDLIWFTGSTASGQQIYAEAGKKFVKVIMELGGSNAGIVFEDANVDKHIDKMYIKRFGGNCGQSCDALKRLLVHESLYEDCVSRLKSIIESKVFASNEDEKADIGPLAAGRQVDLLEAQINDAVDNGATVVTGGKRSETLDGAYYEPTLVTNLSPKMRIWKEEVFGPSLSVIPFSSEDEAVEIANQTDYGLGAVVFTEDSERATRVSRRLQAGSVEINGASHWHHENPFGGYKKSGMGREHGVLGLQELCQVKVVSREK